MQSVRHADGIIFVYTFILLQSAHTDLKPFTGGALDSMSR